MNGAIAELFASLGLKPDTKEWDKARALLLKHGERTQTALDRQRARFARQEGSLERRRMALEANATMRHMAVLDRRMEEVRARKGKKSALGKNVGSYSNLTRGLVPFGMNPAALAGMVGVGAGVAAGRDALRFDEQLTDLDINSKGAMGSIDSVRTRVLAASKAFGVAKEEILGGASAFVAVTGDGKTAAKSLETFAKVKLATNAATSDIARTAAAMSQQLGIVPEQLEKAFSIVHAGAKEGSVEFSDMAGLMASLAASYKGMGKSQGLSGLATLNAMFQVATQDFGGNADAGATGMERLMDAMASPRTIKAAKKLGIDLFDKLPDGTMRVKPMIELLEAFKAAGVDKDPRLLNALMESSEGRRALRASLLQLDTVKRISHETMAANDIAEDAAKRQESSAHKVAKAWNDVKVAVAEAFTPERLDAFANMLTDILDTASRLPGFFKDVLSIDSEVDRSDAAAEVDRRLLAGESLEQIAADQHGGQWGNVRRTAQARLLAQQGDKTSARASAAIAEFERMKAERGAEFGGNVGHGYTAGEANTLAGVAARATATYKPIAPQTTFNLTVTPPPGADPKQMAETIQRVLNPWWDSKMRDLGG